jgi:archaellum component FlaF (FlaF/FlaG flagellin family)
VPADGLAAASPSSVSSALAPARPGPRTTTISVSTGGRQGNQISFDQDISATGRYVAFTSYASNLVAGDTNQSPDVFVRDRRTGTTSRVSVSSTGAQGNGSSDDTAISADGRYVAFRSTASNLVPDPGLDTTHVYVRDRRTGTTSRVSVSSSGVAADSQSLGPDISGDGRYVTFASYGSNLVPGDTNSVADAFVRDRRTGTTTRISVSSTGVEADNVSVGPVISADGRHIAFYSNATNLVPGDTNAGTDVFVHDRRTGAISRVSVSSTRAQANGYGSYFPAISANGRYVTFLSVATNLVPGDTNETLDIFVRDRWRNTTSRVSLATTGAETNDSSWDPSISGNGRYVTFTSYATTLVPRDTNELVDLFIRDRWTNTTSRVNVTALGRQANGDTADHTISTDGRYIAFSTGASNLAPGDTNNQVDVLGRTWTTRP